MNFDDLLKAWSKAKDQFVIDEAPSLCRKDIPDGAINIGQTYSSIAFYGGGSHFDLWRCAYVNPFACNFSRVLEEDKRKKLNGITHQFFEEGGILIIPIPSLKKRNKNNINFLCKILGECSEIEPRSEVSRIPFPLVQIGAEVKQTRWNVIYPEDTILWGCFWPFDIRPIDTEAIELYKYSEIHNTQNDKLKFDNFTYYENHRFRTFSSMNNPYISLDEVAYLDKTLSVSFAVMINTGAIIGVPEVAKDQLIADLVSFKKGSAPELKGFDLIFKWQKQAMAIGTALPENKTPITIPSGPLPELCGALEVNIQDKVTAINDAVSHTQFSDAAGGSTLGEDNNRPQVIDVYFESYKGKMVQYKLNDIELETTLKVAPLHFLAFNAGYKEKYIFAYKQKTGVWLIKDGVNDLDLSPLFKNDDKTLIKNIAGAITDMFISFLPSGKKESKDNVDLIKKCHGLLCKRGLRYPKIEEDEKLKTKLAKEVERLTKETEPLPKDAARLENEAVKRLALVNEKLKMAKVKLLDNIKFKITLSKAFITKLKEMTEYKPINAPSIDNQYKAIIDFIIKTYPPE